MGSLVIQLVVQQLHYLVVVALVLVALELVEVKFLQWPHVGDDGDDGDEDVDEHVDVDVDVKLDEIGHVDENVHAVVARYGVKVDAGVDVGVYVDVKSVLQELQHRFSYEDQDSLAEYTSHP